MSAGEPRTKLGALFGCGGERVQAWGKRLLESRDHTDILPRMEGNCSIRQKMELGVGCRGEESWVNESKAYE